MSTTWTCCPQAHLELLTLARPARTAGTIVKDEGEGGKQLAEFLAGQKFI
ncbi:Electron transfer flavoprotein alpha/beta-subunit [Streptomyces iranensis]|uniref:Electron transfer flavoprotein alpha/beta-subunit n=1 Tax=Streptomyces iranensis TaxID=576784 RepID=A0A060ZZS6_9ACTN|nr:Electron transfer flavoprotein alpha/beta-subunit [Streptomyces iranensis]